MMVLDNSNIILIKVSLIFFAYHSLASLSHRNCCTEEVDESHNVNWPATCNHDKKITSTPSLCIQTNKEIATRTCKSESNSFEPALDEVDCATLQSTNVEHLNYCPENYEYVAESICLTLITNTSYPFKCEYEELLPFDAYKAQIPSEYFPVWMPVYRETTEIYGYGLLYWREPSQYYKIFYRDQEDQYYFKNGIKDKNCALYYNDTYIEIVDCAEKHTTPCGYQVLNNRQTSYCNQVWSNCEQSDYSTHSMCFCTGRGNVTVNRAEFLKTYQNHLYKKLTNEQCYFGLERIEDEFLWSTSKEPLNYTMWSETTDFTDNNYGAISSDGEWILLKEPPTTYNDCVLYQMELTDMEPTLTLNYNFGMFYLTATNSSVWLRNDSRPLIFCITDASKNNLLTTFYMNFEETEDILTASFSPHVHGPGNIWCEGFAYPNETLIKSNKLLHRDSENFLAEYVVHLETEYDSSANPLTDDYTHNELYNSINYLLQDTNIVGRIFAIDDIDEDIHKINVTVHLTSVTFNGTLEEFEEIYSNLSTLENIFVIDLASVDTCFEDTDNLLIWPETAIREDADPVGGFCYDGEKIVKRKCVGNFVHGAKWEPIVNCTFYKASNVSNNLSELNSLDYIVELIKDNVDDLEAIDIYLMELILAQTLAKYQIHLVELMDFIDILLTIPEDILKLANDAFYAVDHILNWVQSYVSRTDEIVSIVKKNVLLFSSNIGFVNVTAILIKNNNVTPVYEEDLYEHNITNYEYDYAIILDKITISQVSMLDPKVVILTFFKNCFFDDTLSYNLSKVSSVSFNNIQNGTFRILYNISEYSVFSDNFCGGWTHQWRASSFWSTLPNSSYYRSSVLACNIDALTDNHPYYSLLSFSIGDITVALHRLLSSTLDSESKLTKLLYLSDFWTLFNAVDVYYTSSIITECDINTENIMNFFSIINNLLYVNKTVMKTSQIEFQATNTILNAFDNYLPLIDNEIATENFKTATLNLISDHIQGLSVKDSHLTFFTDANSLNTALKLVDFDILVIFPTDWTHLTENIILSIFFNDVLFNEVREDKQTSTIIGLTPKSFRFVTNSPIEIYYNTKSFSGDTCAFWNRNKTVTTWRSVPEITEDSTVIKCNFHTFSYYALIELNITSDLENILTSNSTTEEKLKNLIDATKLPWKLNPKDINIIADIFELIAEDDQIDMIQVSLVVDNLMNASSVVLESAQSEYGATDKILYNLDVIASKSVDFDPIVGTYMFKAIMLNVTSNITGLLLEESSHEIHYLYDTNLDDLSENENLDTAVIFSDKLRQQLQNAESPRIVITIFLDDCLFKPNSNMPKSTTKIFGILLTDFEDNEFDGPISLLYNVNSTLNNSCSFWDYEVENRTVVRKGDWNSDNSDKSFVQHITVCDFYHVTHFALLLDSSGDRYKNSDKYKLLDIITDINCSLSAFGILAIILTAVLFEKWRRNTGNKILLNFSLSLSIKIIMLYVSDAIYHHETDADVICAITGSVLHYALLSEFCWMMIIAILQFKRFVEVLGGRPKYILLKACICGWIFPLIPVGLVLSLDWKNYTESSAGLCYPTGMALYLSIWLPIFIIFNINLVIFLYIIYNVCHKKTEYRDTNSHEKLFQWRLALLLFFMLGLTWAFGFLSQIDDGLFVFVYLFCFTASLQGFVMFLFFIVFNKSTRTLYSMGFKTWLYSKNFKHY